MINVHSITEDNVDEAFEAMGAILVLYRELILVPGFIEDARANSFDFWTFLRCEEKTDPSWTLEIDVDLLQSGSGVAVLVNLLTAWSPDRNINSTFAIKVFSELAVGSFDHLPEIRDSISAFKCEDEEAIWMSLERVFKKYVIQYFRSLLKLVGSL